MPKLSDFKPEDIKMVQPASPDKLKLSDFHASEITPVQQPSTEPDTTAYDASLGGLQGLALGGADEIEGGLKAAGDASLNNFIESPGTELDRLKDLYRKYQQTSEGEYKAAKARSPYAYTAGEVAGAVAPAILTAGGGALLGGAKVASELPLLARLGTAAAKGAGVGATAGALGSEGNLDTLENQKKLIGDTEEGGVVGGVLGAAAHGIGELAGKAKGAAKSYIEGLKKEKPFVSQMSAAQQLGKEGTSLSKRTDLGELATRDLENSQDIMSRINAADEMLGQNVGKSIDDAAANGHTIMVPNAIKDKAETIAGFFDSNPALSVDKKSQNLFKGLTSQDVTNLDPKEALVLRDAADDLINRMKGDSSTLANYTRETVSDFRKDVNGLIRDQIPGYREASDRFNEFRKLVPESIIGKGVPTDISGVRMGDLKKPDSRLLSGVQEMIQGSELPGSSTAEAKQTLGMLKQNLAKLENPDFTNQDILNKLGGSSEDFLGDVRKAADTSAVIKQATGVNPQEGSKTLVKGLALSSTTGRGKLLGIANLAGRIQAKVPANLSTNVFNLPSTGLQSIADHLSGSENPTIKSLAASLTKGLQENNPATKNAALFALMQNKDARASIYNMLPGTTSVENLPNQ